MLPAHFSEGRPLVSASAAWIYLACGGSWSLAHLTSPQQKESKILDKGTDLHACTNFRIFQPVETGEIGACEVPQFDQDTQDAADAVFWVLKGIAHPGLFDGSIPRMGEERLTDGILTAAPDLAWIEGDLLRIVDEKKSSWDTLLPAAKDSPQLLIQAGLLLRLWAPAKNVSRVQVGYVTPEGIDLAEPVHAFDIVAKFSELEEKFLKPPVLDFVIGPHCARCNFSHKCPRMEGEKIWPDMQTLSHAELGEAYREASARIKAAEAAKEAADQELTARLEAGASPEEVGFKIRRDSMKFFSDPVGFLKRHGIALESTIKNLTLASARKLLAEKNDRALTEQELADLETEASTKFKSPFLAPVKRNP